MSASVHEEYSNISKNIPFVFHPNLERTPSTCRAEKNWHENIEIQICLSGEGYVLLDGDKFSFTKGDIIAVNSNVIHYTYTPKNLSYACIIFDTEFLKRIEVNYNCLLFNSKIKSQEILNYVSELTSVYLNEDTPCRTAKLNQIVLKIIICMVENYSVLTANLKVKHTSFEVVKKAINYARENYNRKLTLEEIAKHVFTDKFTLSREFKKITGQTVINYVNLYRCQKAIELIESGENVIEASYKCGFENPSFFSKVFKKHVGKLPSKFK